MLFAQSRKLLYAFVWHCFYDFHWICGAMICFCVAGACLRFGLISNSSAAIFGECGETAASIVALLAACYVVDSDCVCCGRRHRRGRCH